jgi:hypothetical protein
MSLDADSSLIEWVNRVGGTWPFMRAILFLVIVARLVHTDPLVSTDAFWLTRPISRGVLFASKLGTMVLVLIAPATLAQAAPMIAYGVPPLDQMPVLTENLVYWIAGVTAAVAAAALTSKLRSLAVLVLALAVVWAGASLMAASAYVALHTTDDTNIASVQKPAIPGYGPPSAAQKATTLVIMVTGFGAAGWHQFRTRRREHSAAIAASTVVVLFVLPYFFFPQTGQARTASFTENPAVPLAAGMRAQDGASSVAMWPFGDRDGQCGVMVRVTQTQGIQTALSTPWPFYRFVHRPTGKPIVSTYFALPDRNRELAAGVRAVGSESFELFQVLYRYEVVGPIFASSDPRNTEVKSVPCNEIDVVVRHWH